MRRVLILALALALGLAACGLTAPKSGSAPPAAPAATPGLAGIAADTIEVTPLNAPAPTPADTSSTPPAAAPAAALDTIPVQAATADTVHPRPRPAGLAKGAAAAEPPPDPPKSQAQILCEGGGGIWGQSSDSGAFVCQKSMRDGGKLCHQKGDCDGECLARSNTCSPVKPLLGCNDVLDSEGRMVNLCLD
jgi:hypothetical protein